MAFHIYFQNKTFYDYAKISSFNISYNRTNNQLNYTQIDLIPWSLGEFVGNNSDLRDTDDILYCFRVPEDLVLAGGFNTNFIKYITVNYAWTTLAGNMTIEDLSNLQSTHIYSQIYLLSPYIDYSDIENPLKYAYVDKYVVNINPKAYTVHSIYVRKNKYSLDDNLLYGDIKNGSFYTISEQQSSQYPYYPGSICEITFNIDNQIMNYERKVYNLYDMIGDVGGIYSVLISIFLLFMNKYTEKLYNYSATTDYLRYKSNLTTTKARQDILEEASQPINEDGHSSILTQKLKKINSNRELLYLNEENLSLMPIEELKETFWAKLSKKIEVTKVEKSQFNILKDKISNI